MQSPNLPETTLGWYEAVKARYLAQGHIHSMCECPAATMQLPDNEKLVACAISNCTVQLYRWDGKDNGEPPSFNDGLDGRHIFVMTPTGRSSVILISSEYPNDDQANLLRIAILYHELGHADDFSKSINFNHDTLAFDLPRAEEYADAFAMQNLQDFTFQIEKIQFTIWDFYNERRYKGKYERTIPLLKDAYQPS